MAAILWSVVAVSGLAAVEPCIDSSGKAGRVVIKMMKIKTTMIIELIK